MKTVFVTGATGVLGSALIPLYLNDPDTEIRLLIRAGAARGARERLDLLFKFWGPRFDTSPNRDRVVPLQGDVTLPDLGLGARKYRSIAAEVTHIVHAAANVSIRKQFCMSLLL